MKEIYYIDRLTQKIEQELVYGKFFIELLYGPTLFSRLLYKTIMPLICRFSLPSKIYGFLQKSPKSKKKIAPFIKKFHVDVTEFLNPVTSYTSFNDFFIRKLKPDVRPMSHAKNIAVMPADARYLFYQNIAASDGFLIKGAKFSIDDLLQDPELSKRYTGGAMLLARLCPTDYHRFHFPSDATLCDTRELPGALFSVNPMALRRNIQIFTENKRSITTIQTEEFGQILYIAVGATYVGTIHHTYKKMGPYAKGEELGYFSFGGSSLVLLFEPGKILFDADLIANSAQKIETRALLGQSLGHSIKTNR